MAQAPTDTVKDIYAAFDRGDIPAILESLDENVDWRVPETLPHGGSFTSRDAVGGFFQGIGEHWDGIQVDVENVIGDGERVVVVAHIHGQLRATGEQTGFRSVHVWTVSNGHPVRFAEYVDAPVALPAARAMA